MTAIHKTLERLTPDELPQAGLLQADVANDREDDA
jgi:hypothetical protein